MVTLHEGHPAISRSKSINFADLRDEGPYCNSRMIALLEDEREGITDLGQSVNASMNSLRNVLKSSPRARHFFKLPSVMFFSR